MIRSVSGPSRLHPLMVSRPWPTRNRVEPRLVRCSDGRRCPGLSAPSRVYSPAFSNGEQQADAEQGGRERHARQRHLVRTPGSKALVRIARDRWSAMCIHRPRARVNPGPGWLGGTVSMPRQRQYRRRGHTVAVAGLRRRSREYGERQAESQTLEEPLPSSMISHGCRCPSPFGCQQDARDRPLLPTSAPLRSRAAWTSGTSAVSRRAIRNIPAGSNSHR
jgi:hypothetical protein